MGRLQGVNVLSYFTVVHVRGDDAWRHPFEPDNNAVALFHFDEGAGDETHDAPGDKALTLRANNGGCGDSATALAPQHLDMV